MLSFGDRLGFADPSVGSLQGFLRRAYLIFYYGTTLLLQLFQRKFFGRCRFFGWILGKFPPFFSDFSKGITSLPFQKIRKRGIKPGFQIGRHVLWMLREV